MPETVHHFFSKVVGVTHPNADGSSRQSAISQAQPGEPLALVFEDENPYSRNAVAVCRANGQQLGYLREELAESIMQSVRAGRVFHCFAWQITGGIRGKTALGLNLLMVVADDDQVPDAEVMRYVEMTFGLTAKPHSPPSGDFFVIDDTE